MELNIVISVLALLIAGFALMISFHEALSNKPKLKVNLKNAVLVSGGVLISPKSGCNKCDILKVQVINIGRQPTTLGSIYFKHPKIKGSLAAVFDSTISSPANSLLGPGEEASFYFPSRTDTITLDGSNHTLHSLVNVMGGQVYVDHTWNNKPKKARVK